MTDTPLAPIPPSPQANSSAVPSGSSAASAGGALAAWALFLILDHYGIHLAAGNEAMVGGLIATLLGYLPKSGRQ